MTATAIVDRYQPLGYKEIASLLEVKPTTVRMWKYHDMLPPPDWPEVHGMPAWALLTILQWAASSGRLCTPGLVEQYKSLTGNDPPPPRLPGRPSKETS